MMRLTLRPATIEHYDFVYQVKAVTLKEYIAQTWGWDEADQQSRFSASFDPTQWQIVQLGGRDIGVLCLESEEGGLFPRQHRASATVPESRDWHPHHRRHPGISAA